MLISELQESQARAVLMSDSQGIQACALLMTEAQRKPWTSRGIVHSRSHTKVEAQCNCRGPLKQISDCMLHHWYGANQGAIMKIPSFVHFSAISADVMDKGLDDEQEKQRGEQIPCTWFLVIQESPLSIFA